MSRPALLSQTRQDTGHQLIRLKNPELGITFVYVTHDQEEALTTSDTIVVTKINPADSAPPEDIYNEPQTICGRLYQQQASCHHVGTSRKLGSNLAVWLDVGFGRNTPVDAAIRPEIDLG